MQMLLRFAGQLNEWPEPRDRRGIITQSSPLGETRHSGMLSLNKIKFVNYGTDQPAFALEACAKCKVMQGGFHTYTSNISFAQVRALLRFAISVCVNPQNGQII